MDPFNNLTDYFNTPRWSSLCTSPMFVAAIHTAFEHPEWAQAILKSAQATFPDGALATLANGIVLDNPIHEEN